jgi:hypothetical protein
MAGLHSICCALADEQRRRVRRWVRGRFDYHLDENRTPIIAASCHRISAVFLGGSWPVYSLRIVGWNATCLVCELEDLN